jgi:hypothetical protein
MYVKSDLCLKQSIKTKKPLLFSGGGEVKSRGHYENTQFDYNRSWQGGQVKKTGIVQFSAVSVPKIGPGAPVRGSAGGLFWQKIWQSRGHRGRRTAAFSYKTPLWWSIRYDRTQKGITG